jgi:hypothetical protein
MTPQCRLCSGHDLDAVCESDDIRLYQCGDCGLVQNHAADQGFAVQHQGEFRSEYLQQLALRLQEKFDLRSQRTLVISPNDDDFADQLSALGLQTQQLSDPDTGADPCPVFAVRCAVEHETDIGAFMHRIKQRISNDAVGLIEVNRLESRLPAFDPADDFWKQRNHFGLSTLGILVEIHGFDIIDMFMGWHQRKNCVLVRRRRPWVFGDVTQDLVLSFDDKGIQ